MTLDVETDPGWRTKAQRVIKQRWFRYATGLLAALVVTLAAVILWTLWNNSQGAWAEWGLSFLWRTQWDPVAGEFGALPFILGTLLTSLMALFLALPISWGIAILLSEYMPRALRDPLIFIVELLAAVPSVVFGLWGIFVLAPLLRGHLIPVLASSPLGWLPIFGEPGPVFNLFTASVILAIMIIPIIATLSRESLLAVPEDQKEAALALGATRWEAVRDVAMPYCKPGLFSAGVLGLGRALGETMAVTMLIGNDVNVTFDYFESGYSMTAIIANEFREAVTSLQVESLVAIGLVLFGLSFVLNTIGRVIIMSYHTKATEGL